MKPWFEDFKELIRSDAVLKFWPTNDQSPAERVNATSRFIIYATCVIYLIRRDPRIFVLGATVLGVLVVMYRSNMVKTGNSPYPEGCQMPTKDNPMANVLMTDYTDSPARPSACAFGSVKYPANGALYDSGRSRTTHPEYRRRAADRQFVTMPVTEIPGDQTAYAEWLYGPKLGAMCKSGDTFACDPNARGVQLEAFAGIDSDGDRRR
jgi:hypothetical protein